MPVLSDCEPKRVFHYFEEICRIPHGSGNTAQISDYLADFAREHRLFYVQDDMGNIVIKKPGTPGYENSPAVIIQGHMDMVCEKASAVEHDFTKDGLKLRVTEDGYVQAGGTTLGGDDGIAVAYGLALLESRDIPHPPLEVLITVDEEIGLLGAAGVDCRILDGKRMINLDSEAEGTLLVSCAGGLSAFSTIGVQRVSAEGTRLELTISGLAGGHSGAEIHKNRANANMLMGRVLYTLQKKVDFEIESLEGGTKDNAIPKECHAGLAVLRDDVPEILEFAAEIQKKLREEYAGTDEEITVAVNDHGDGSFMVLHPSSREKVLFFLMNMPWGVAKMSGTIPGLVETSCNMGILRLEENGLFAETSVRSSVLAARDALTDKIEYLTLFLGGDFEIQGAYPAWEYRADSQLRDIMTRVFEEQYGKKPEIAAIHAGLECGLFYKKIDSLDCVSLGPNMVDIHTCTEKLEIASVERVWKYLVRVLGELKN